MAHANRLHSNKNYKIDPFGHFVIEESAPEKTTPRKPLSMAEFLRSDPSTLKKLYVAALDEADREQLAVIEAARRKKLRR